MKASKLTGAVLSGAGVGIGLEYILTRIFGEFAGAMASCVILWLVVVWLWIDARREQREFDETMREFEKRFSRPSGTVPTGKE